MKLTALYEDGTEEKFDAANDCQVWRHSKNVFSLHPKASIRVETDDGEELKRLALVETKRGMVMANILGKRVGSMKEAATEDASSKKSIKKGGCIFITA